LNLAAFARRRAEGVSHPKHHVRPRGTDGARSTCRKSGFGEYGSAMEMTLGRA
jgi:hypothetical protein